MLPKQSSMMDKLYGSDIAKIVYNRCQELGQDFNERVQSYVYDTIWAKPGLLLKEKSLITVVTLIALNKAEQLKIHLWGLFYQGGSAQDILNLLAYMKQQGYLARIDKAIAILEMAQKEFNHLTKRSLSNVNQTLIFDDQVKEKRMIDLVAQIILGNHDKIETCLKQVILDHALTIEEIKLILQHVAVYGGFPIEMNGLSILNKII
ncbi:MAG: hypothetical protein A3E87_00290 [Gammaproteobacteria bacterium RIFCSPHIGHO2_12_FULL_35_23]|nr:MAG: hypothetical protein A3E87_00290 [Gammaproteobacteria bacterium RIFCSPHIGHO2_12_FULL_35_23]